MKTIITITPIRVYQIYLKRNTLIQKTIPSTTMYYIILIHKQKSGYGIKEVISLLGIKIEKTIKTMTNIALRLLTMIRQVAIERNEIKIFKLTV